MASCLKRLCITFSVIYGILGCITLVLGILAASFRDKADDIDTSFAVTLFCVSGSLVVLLALLGFFSAYKEKRIALRVYVAFLVLHGIGCFRALLILGPLPGQINESFMAEFKKMTPLNRADSKIQNTMDSLQTTLECCGLLSYDDWEKSSIPQSCQCPLEYENRASKCHTIELSRERSSYWDRSLYRDPSRSTVEVYKKPCGPIVLNYMKMGIHFLTGLFVTFLIILILSTILHLLLYIELRSQTAATPRTFSETPNPPPQYTRVQKGSPY